MVRLCLWVGIAIAALALIAVALNALLTPDDLRFCDKRPSGAENCQAADAIIAVSGGNTMSRVKSAVELYKDGWGKKIIFSGAASDPDSPSNAVAMRDMAVGLGVPKGAIIVEETSANTRENAENTAKILKRHVVKGVILVTSQYHVRRVAWEFGRAAPEVDSRAHPADDPSWHWWFFKPSGWWRAIYELGGLITFGIRGMF
jgi:uncharacterized SAM-binding protein YcdF (DUF218 family)